MLDLSSTINITYGAIPTPELSYQVPLLIHLLWMGSIIPEEYVSNIRAWAERNTHYQVCRRGGYFVC